jgi:hypothetical protein
MFRPPSKTRENARLFSGTVGTILLPPVTPITSQCVVQSMWVGDSLSFLETLSIKSFLANGHEFHLYLYGSCAGVPEGTIIKDANEIMPKSRIPAYRCLQIFSDEFRYRLLQMRESWWVDVDVICLRPFDFVEPYVFASEIITDCPPYPNNYMLVNQCVLHAPSDSEFLRRAVDFCESKDPMTFRGYWGGEVGMGPELVTDLTLELGLMEYVQPRDVFAPIRCQRTPDDFLNPALNLDLRKTYAIHGFQSQWRDKKNGAYHSSCLYEQLKTRYHA